MAAQNEDKMREAFEKWYVEPPIKSVTASMMKEVYFEVWKAAIAQGEQERRQLEAELDSMNINCQGWIARSNEQKKLLSESQKRENELQKEITRLTELGRKNLGRAIVAENELAKYAASVSSAMGHRSRIWTKVDVLS
jgi:hypothetical protein